MGSMTCVLTFVCALIALAVGSADVGVGVGAGTLDFSRMKVRELKQFIASKGTECLACSSKEDLVTRATEVRDWPDVPEETPSSEDMRKIFENLKTDEERMAKLKEELAKAGVDVSKLGKNIFSAEDLQKVFKKGDEGTEKGEKKTEDGGKEEPLTKETKDEAKTEL